MNSKYLLVLTASMALHLPASAIASENCNLDKLAEFQNSVDKNAAFMDAMVTLSGKCKISVEVYGTDGLMRESCESTFSKLERAQSILQEISFEEISSCPESRARRKDEKFLANITNFSDNIAVINELISS